MSREQIAEQLYRYVVAAAGASPVRPLVVGICGAQGSGKSTAAAAVASRLRDEGWRVLSMSLDDFYLTRAKRQELADTVHPLLRVRGVPGTHDVELAIRTLDAAQRPAPFTVPQFDKAADDRVPVALWPEVAGPVDIVLFEGWCVGAIPQPETALREPINALERERDADGAWRRYVNTMLAGCYAGLFARLDTLILLAAPDFDVVAGWRREQEHELRKQLLASGKVADATMSDAQIDQFVSYYERLTRHILDAVPSRAELVIRLDRSRRIASIDEYCASTATR